MVCLKCKQSPSRALATPKLNPNLIWCYYVAAEAGLRPVGGR